jgi:RNA polymerase sigma factor (sigma-70 family)
MAPEELFEAHRGHVLRAARRRWRQIRGAGPHLEFDDLHNAALLAAWKTALTFDPSVGVPFWAHARHRIVGAMVDQIREYSPFSRTAVTAGIHERQFDVYPDPRGEANEVDRVEARPGPLLLDLKDHVRRLLRHAQDRLAECLRLYYLDGLLMAEVGRRVGLSESRVSQSISQGLEQIREACRDEPV